MSTVAAELAVAAARARPGSGLEKRYLAQLESEQALRAQAKGELPGPAELTELVPRIGSALQDYMVRRGARHEVADYIEAQIVPRTNCTQLMRLPDRLRRARSRAWVQYSSEARKVRYVWDRKAGEPLLCPDDAREEAQRLNRRLEDRLEGLMSQGLRCYYAVLTVPNSPKGELQAGIDGLWSRFRRVIKLKRPKAADDPRPAKQLPKRFPILGAIAVLEAPLSRLRDWHPHLNVILITRGRLNWADWHQAWQYVCDFRVLKPGNVDQAMRELIKYSVRTVPEKSAAKASEAALEAQSADLFPDKLTPPAMTEWSAKEWLEWWRAMKGHRRTRTYGDLYGIGEQEPETVHDWRSIARADWKAGRFALWCPSLEFILGDKSNRACWISQREDGPQPGLSHGPPSSEGSRGDSLPGFDDEGLQNR